MNEPFAQMRDHFLRAMEHPGLEAQLKYVEGQCAENAEMAKQLAEMLKAHHRSDDFLTFKPSGTESFIEEEVSVGTAIGPYKLLQKIGEGGMGIVYMAEQAEPIRRRVALKVIKPGMDSRQVIARFESERQALSMMDHPHIARVLDAGMTDRGRPYFVMELVKGQPITQYCDEKHLTPRQRLELLLPVCNAMMHAHQKGIIHRDIKPSNILVAEYDHLTAPKVIDFGVAKAVNQPLTDKTMFTAYGQVVGTLEYMSPEQAKVNQLDIDTRSDIYSLGVVLYELLTGTTPLDKLRLRSAAWDEMLRIIREEEPPKPSTRLSDSKDTLASISAQRQMEPAKLTKAIRGELDWIVMKSLDKDRNRRYSTASELALDIQRYLNNESVQACPPSLRYRVAKFAAKYRTATIVATMFVLLLLAGITGTAIGLIRSEVSRARAETALKNEAEQRRVAESLAQSERQAKELATAARSRAEASAIALSQKSNELQKELYVNLVGRALGDWRGNNVTDSLRRLQACPPELRHWEWDFVNRLCHLDRWTNAGNGDCIWAAAISPDGKWVASGSGPYLWAMQAGKGKVAIRDAVTGKLLFEEEGLRGGVQGVAFSPDGKKVACCTSYWSQGNDFKKKEGEIIVWDMSTQKRLWTQSRPATTMLCVAFSRDGSKIAVGTGGYNSAVGELAAVGAIYDSESGKAIVDLKSGGGTVHSLAFSPDGKRIALGESEQAELFNLEDGALVRAYKGHLSYVYAVAFSPDGSRLATGEYAPPVRIWNVETGLLETQIQDDQARGLAFNHDGSSLAIATGLGQTVKICNAQTGATLATLRGHLAPTMCVAFHPELNQLVSGSQDGVLKMWDAKQQPLGLDHDSQKTEHPWITGVAADPRGRRVFTASRDNTVQLWDADHGERIRTWRGPSGPNSNWTDTFWSVAVSPDGRQVFAGHGHGTILRWDAETGAALTPIKTKSAMVLALAVSTDGRFLASSAMDRLIRLWSIPSGDLIREIPVSLPGNLITCLEFSPDSARLLAGSGNLLFLDSPSGLGAWDVATGNSLWSRAAAKVSVRDVTFSPDGQTFVTAMHDGRIAVCEAASGKEKTSFAAFNTNAMAAMYSPDGKRLITGGTEGIKVWETNGWSEMFAYRDHPVLCLALGDQGKKLAYGGYYPTAVVLDATPYPANAVSTPEIR